MAETLGTAIVEITANLAPLRAGLASAESATAASLRRMQGESGAFSRNMGNIGATLTRSVTIPIVGIAAAAAKMGMDFSRSMELLHTQAGEAQSRIAGLS